MRACLLLGLCHCKIQITPHAQTSNWQLSYTTPGVRAITATQPRTQRRSQIEQQQNQHRHFYCDKNMTSVGVTATQADGSRCRPWPIRMDKAAPDEGAELGPAARDEPAAGVVLDKPGDKRHRARAADFPLLSFLPLVPGGAGLLYAFARWSCRICGRPLVSVIFVGVSAFHAVL